MDSSENDGELLGGISEENESQYMIQRMTVDNAHLLNSDLLAQHNNLVVDLESGDFIPVNYPSADDLLTQHLTQEDRGLAATLVAVQLRQQQKHQQNHQQLILTDKVTNGYIQIVGSEALYVEAYDGNGSVKVEDEESFQDIEAVRNTEVKSEIRTPRKSLPHKKRISHKLKKNSPMSRYKLNKCALCDDRFATIDELEDHQQTCQTTITPISSMFNCQLCSAGFHDQLTFFEHLKSHYEPIVQVHINEEESEITEDTHIKHTLKMEAMDPPKDSLLTSLLNLHCLECNKTFKRQKAYEAHIRDVHNKVELSEFSEPEDLMAGIDVVVDPNEQHSDDETKCWSNYRDEELHATEEDLMEIEAQDHICHICKQPFPIRAILLQHLITCRATNEQTEEPNGLPKKKSKKKKEEHACTECDRIFTHRNSLVYHMRSHTGDRPHQCEHCGKSFFAASALKVHMRLHSGVKPYKCEACGRFFRQWGDLKYHSISIHSNQKQYQCEYCGKDFARKYSLIVHRRIHTGEKNYKCEYCGKTFRASSYLQNHRRIHTGEKPHTCEVCGKPFRVRSDMKRHMKTHGRRRNGRAVQTSPCDLVITKIEQTETIDDDIIGECETDEDMESSESQIRENAIAVQALHFGEDELETVQDSHGNTVYVMPVILT